jgi:hypothetical protein
VRQLVLYKTSLHYRTKDAMIKDFKLIFIYFNSLIIEPLYTKHPISSLFAIFATLEALGGGLQMFLKLKNRKTMCEDSSSFEFTSLFI